MIPFETMIALGLALLALGMMMFLRMICRPVDTKFSAVLDEPDSGEPTEQVETIKQGCGSGLYGTYHSLFPRDHNCGDKVYLGYGLTDIVLCRECGGYACAIRPRQSYSMGQPAIIHKRWGSRDE